MGRERIASMGAFAVLSEAFTVIGGDHHQRPIDRTGPRDGPHQRVERRIGGADGRIVGDVDFEGVSKVASAITPVPGGVGPMTITMLLANTVEAARRTRDGVPRAPEDALIRE